MQTPQDVHEDSTVYRSVITRLATLAASRSLVTFGVWLTVFAVGVLAFVGGLAREGFPPVDIPVVIVSGSYFVDDADQVDAEVAEPLQAMYADVEGIANIQTYSRGNGYFLVVEFESGYSSPEGATALEAADAEPNLPEAASLNIRTIDATKFLDLYDVLVTVTGPDDASAEELEAQATLLQAHLEALPSVERADVKLLLTEGVNPTTGETDIRRTRFTRVALNSEDGYREAIAVGLIRNDAAGLDTLGFSEAINDALSSSNPLAGPGLDDGFAATTTADFATAIRTQIGSLTKNLLSGLLAVALVSLLLIGWRAAVITAAFMATVMLASLAGLWFLGYSLNTITMFGLILTLGLLVDDAIVISESLDANRDSSPDPLGVVRTSINRVGSASLAGTLTTVLVFAPMLFVSGVLGKFIRAIPATVILTLLLSFFFSVIFIPAVARPFLLNGKPSNNIVVRAEKAIGRWLGRLAEYPSSHGLKGVAVGLGIVVATVGIIFSSFSVASSVGFNIFPPGDDADALAIEIDFPPGGSIEYAQEVSAEIDAIVVDVLGDDLLRSQYISGNERSAFTFVDLVPFNTRDTKAPVYVERLEEQLASVQGARISVGTQENGPPVEDFPFAAQIKVPDGGIDAAQELAEDLRAALVGAKLDKSSGEETTILDAIISTEGQVYRSNGARQLEVRASFSNDDLTNNLTATEEMVDSLFPKAELQDRGLGGNAIEFDFGQESDNQEDFASLGKALIVALGLMFLLLIVQFRSVVQPVLIFLAIPFSFMGVFTALKWSGNPISFFVAVGFIALIGVVVNNTILLIDAANQGRRDGLRPGEAIGNAVSRRFRPLIATTITTVVGLLPLALSDPFWEALSFTLIGGLISSTILVLLAFPVFYLATEKVRTPLRNFVRARMGRDLI